MGTIEGQDPQAADPHFHRRRLRLYLILLLPAIGLLMVLLALRELKLEQSSGSGAGISDLAGVPVPVDRSAPAFRLPAVGGSGFVSLGDFSGGVVVLNFWASWCGPCRQEAPLLAALASEFGSKGVQFVGVDHRDTQSDAMAFQREFGITYPSGFDPAGGVAERYGVLGIPTTFIIAPDGRIKYQILGRVREISFRQALDRVLGQTVR